VIICARVPAARRSTGDLEEQNCHLIGGVPGYDPWNSTP
jgi:hypothetical protein